jgi:hypothetical protein
MSGSGIWERFENDPRHDENARLRASDRDRDVVNDVLGTAYAEGRLTPDELDERTDQVAHAKTLGQLPPLLADLVAPTSGAGLTVRNLHGEAERRYRSQRHAALMNFLMPSLICWVIWFAIGQGHGFPWPAFVMIPTGINWLRLATSREDSIASIERGLEKKERRRLAAKRRELSRRPDPPVDPDN